jgi:hypothetical protein
MLHNEWKQIHPNYNNEMLYPREKDPKWGKDVGGKDHTERIKNQNDTCVLNWQHEKPEATESHT